MISGGAEGTRTPDPHTASVVRYQLRHSPNLTRQHSARAKQRGYTTAHGAKPPTDPTSDTPDPSSPLITGFRGPGTILGPSTVTHDRRQEETS